MFLSQWTRSSSVLGAFGTTENDTVLHTDERFLPRRVATRGSWNYQLHDCGSDVGSPTMTYYLNKLQRLDEDEHYCVTLNRADAGTDQLRQL